MLQRESTLVLIVDVQERITGVMHERARLLEQLEKLIRGADVLDLPILLTEQYPKGLGETIEEIRKVLPQYDPVVKNTFSCCDDPGFEDRLRNTGRGNVLLAGIEAHVCVYQTAAQLLEMGYHVEVIADAVDSRSPFDRKIALKKMQTLGALLSTTEMALFELQQVASGDRFKAISHIIK